MNDGSFIDLRLNRQEGQVNESFWPSFTDIMTVIVMIFMIAMVVLLMRNMELVNQLRSTMEAERIAAELARATGEEKDSLSVALHKTEERLQLMQLEVLRLQDQGVRKETVIAEQLRAISGLTGERDELTQRAAQLMLLRQRLEADVESKKNQIANAQQQLTSTQQQVTSAQQQIVSLQSNLGDMQTRYDLSQDQLAQLQQTVSSQRQTLDQTRQQRAEVERKYLILVGDFDNLKGKYDKLIRPARSANGRHLVEVRYWKADGDYHITWREGTVDAYQTITRKQLDNVLTRLAEQEVNGLYIKVIFPEESGLSYSEAWEFTSYLHKNYDYYFRTENAQ